MIPTLTISEEYQLILDDIFDADETATEECINDFCEQIGLANCPENAEEIMSNVIEHEDFLATIHQHYQSSIVDISV